jgi:hypothetical protein
VLHLQHASASRSSAQAGFTGALVAAGQDTGIQVFPYTYPCVAGQVSCGVRMHMHMHIILQDAF